MNFSQQMESLLDDLASTQTAYGGGSAAALTAAASCALVRMVAGHVLKRKLDDAIRTAVVGIAARLERIQAMLGRLAEEDAAAFSALWDCKRAVGGVRPLPPETIGTALVVPMSMTAAIEQALSDVAALRPYAGESLGHDLNAGAWMLAGAAAAAIQMMEANLEDVPDRAERDRLRTEAGLMLQRCREWRARVTEGVSRPDDPEPRALKT